jgi:hypothetical protein
MRVRESFHIFQRERQTKIESEQKRVSARCTQTGTCVVFYVFVIMHILRLAQGIAISSDQPLSASSYTLLVPWKDVRSTTPADILPLYATGEGDTSATN